MTLLFEWSHRVPTSHSCMSHGQNTMAYMVIPPSWIWENYIYIYVYIYICIYIYMYIYIYNSPTWNKWVRWDNSPYWPLFQGGRSEVVIGRDDHPWTWKKLPCNLTVSDVSRLKKPGCELGGSTVFCSLYIYLLHAVPTLDCNDAVSTSRTPLLIINQWVFDAAHAMFQVLQVKNPSVRYSRSEFLNWSHRC